MWLCKCTRLNAEWKSSGGGVAALLQRWARCRAPGSRTQSAVYSLCDRLKKPEYPRTASSHWLSYCCFAVWAMYPTARCPGAFWPWSLFSPRSELWVKDAKSLSRVGRGALIRPSSLFLFLATFSLEKGIWESEITKISIKQLLIKVFAVHSCMHTTSSQSFLSRSPN